MEIETLRRGAEAATKGPWMVRYVEAPWSDGNEVDGIYAEASEDYDKRIVETDSGAYPPKKADAEFIATFNPKLVLELLAQIADMERINNDVRSRRREGDGIFGGM